MHKHMISYREQPLIEPLMSALVAGIPSLVALGLQSSGPKSLGHCASKSSGPSASLPGGLMSGGLRNPIVISCTFCDGYHLPVCLYSIHNGVSNHSKVTVMAAVLCYFFWDQRSFSNSQSAMLQPKRPSLNSQPALKWQ